ncbi:MAG TPA: DUF2163 domain-containing protein [Caulobacteraceae bacterium]|jgi:uncharacterized phage protein (TIGR02218 family)|nr:DUF2163 domain-containing protein [Caulobacteraceae bacterium]
MGSILRPCSPALAAALAAGAPLWRADLFSFTLADGVTVLNWSSWDGPLTCAGVANASQRPWIERSNWNVANTLEVPSLACRLVALGDGFAGGAQIKLQIHNGLFDGASFLLSRAFMTAPGDADALGAIALFGGKVGGVDIIGTTATLTIKGKVNDLEQNVPRNLYQIGCNHAFCDAGCTLSRASFTAAFTAGAAPTPVFIPWSGSPPGNATSYQNGTLTMTGGPASGQRRMIATADSTGLTLAYPLYQTPAPGDAFTAFQGCDKTLNSGSGQSCTDRANTLNYRGYPFVPPPNTAY